MLKAMCYGEGSLLNGDMMVGLHMLSKICHSHLRT